MTFTAKPKVEDTAHQWLARANLDPDDPHSADTIAQALMLALELATFAPSLSGSTAVDRLVRQRKPSNGEERAALEALRQASFRLLRIRSVARDGVLPVEDLATGKTLSILDRAIPVATTGLALAARLCPLPGGIFGTVGPLTPLDDAAFAVAMGFVRPGKGVANPPRCAAAVLPACRAARRAANPWPEPFPRNRGRSAALRTRRQRTRFARPRVGQAFERCRASLRQRERGAEPHFRGPPHRGPRIFDRGAARREAPACRCLFAVGVDPNGDHAAARRRWVRRGRGAARSRGRRDRAWHRRKLAPQRGARPV